MSAQAILKNVKGSKAYLRLSQSLDGVDHTTLGPPVPAVFRHFIEQVGLTGLIYGRRT
jgi:hypothetical protein